MGPLYRWDPLEREMTEKRFLSFLGRLRADLADSFRSRPEMDISEGVKGSVCGFFRFLAFTGPPLPRIRKKDPPPDLVAKGHLGTMKSIFAWSELTLALPESNSWYKSVTRHGGQNLL